jgi:hypothetical protein
MNSVSLDEATRMFEASTASIRPQTVDEHRLCAAQSVLGPAVRGEIPGFVDSASSTIKGKALEAYFELQSLLGVYAPRGAGGKPSVSLSFSY